MDEIYDSTTLALVPYKPEETPPPSEKKHVRLIPLVLCAAAVFFYSSVAADYIKDLSLNEYFLPRLMIGDFVGGAGNVYHLPDKADEYSLDDGCGESAEDITLERLEKLASGETVPSVINTETPYDVNIDDILIEPRVIEPLDELYEKYGDNAPVVLVLHTHGTEAYADHADDGYRTKGRDGVIGIGSVICGSLRENGINTLHCEAAFDEPDFNSAYYAAAMAIRDYLREYPSIRYIIDVHRDSITMPDGSYYRTEAEIGGDSAARLMFVVGTDYAGSGHSLWRDNLALCARLEVAIEEENRGVMRGLNIRAASFNQQYTSGSMLVEVGSCANTYEEAARSAEELARALCAEIKQ